MKVKEFYKTITTKAAIVKETDPIHKVVAEVMKDPKTRNAYVVDENGRLVGVVVARDILHLIGGQFIRRRLGLVREALATRAKDIMRSAICVSLEDTAEKALEICVKNGLEELPVCKNGRVVGEKRKKEILEKIGEIETRGRYIPPEVRFHR